MLRSTTMFILVDQSLNVRFGFSNNGRAIVYEQERGLVSSGNWVSKLSCKTLIAVLARHTADFDSFNTTEFVSPVRSYL